MGGHSNASLSDDKIHDTHRTDMTFLMEVLQLREASLAKKRKVSAIVASGDTYISEGVNNMPGHLYGGKTEDENGETIPYVIHAEEEAIMYMLRERLVSQDKELTIYCSYSPCVNCCKLIYQAGIKRVVFVEKHEVNFDACAFPPSEFFRNNSIEVLHYTEEYITQQCRELGIF